MVACSRERMFGRLAVVGIDKDGVGAYFLENMCDVCIVVAEIGQDKARAMPRDVYGQRRGDAVGCGSDALGAVDVGENGSTGLPRGQVYDLTFEAVWERWLRAMKEGSERVEGPHEKDDGFETNVLQTPGV